MKACALGIACLFTTALAAPMSEQQQPQREVQDVSMMMSPMAIPTHANAKSMDMTMPMMGEQMGS